MPHLDAIARSVLCGRSYLRFAARAINARRRGAADFGIANQLAVFFDGRPVTPGSYDEPTAAGDTGRCIR